MAGMKNPKIKDLKQRINDLASRRNIKIRKGSKRYWKAVTKSIIAWLWLRREVDRTKLQRRKEKIQDLSQGINLYMDIGKGWIMKCIKNPILSMVT